MGSGSISRLYSFVTLIGIASTAGCGESSAGLSVKPVAQDGWSTFCMGRLLVSLPPSAELAAGEVKFNDAYGFAGIENVQTWGRSRWGNAEFSESVPTDSARLQKVFSEAKAGLRSGDSNKHAILEARKDVDRWRGKVAKSEPGKSAELFKEILASKEQLLKELTTESTAVGVATSVSNVEFAVRPYDSEFAVGFWDPKDQRIRTVKGELQSLEPKGPDAAANELRRWRTIYTARIPSEIPAKPGFCSSFGFFDESKEIDAKAKAKIPFRLKEHPNLLFFLSTEPASEDGPANILDLPDMAIGRAQLDLIGVKARHGADKVKILGSPGRVYAQEYGPNCASKDDCRPADQAYEIHAETFGEAGRLDRPHLILYMVAATSDEYKAKRKPVPGNPRYNTPERPALKGHVPPPYKVGREIFDQVLRSIRIRPGAISGQN
jgi:hypothetical protein